MRGWARAAWMALAVAGVGVGCASGPKRPGAAAVAEAPDPEVCCLEKERRGLYFGPGQDMCASEEACDARCSIDNDAACLRRSRFVERDGGDATSAWKKECTRGSREACLRLAMRDDVETAKTACTMGLADACEAAGMTLLRAGEAAQAKPWFEKAATAFAEACTAGSGFDCAAMGALYDDGLLGKRDTAIAYAAFKRACELGDEIGCERAPGMAGTRKEMDAACVEGGGGCRFVGLRQEVGRGAADLDPVAAAEKYKAACEKHDDRACLLFAYCLEHGIGVRQDRVLAHTHYYAQCRDRATAVPEACYGMGRVYLSIGNVEVAAGWLHLACTESGLGCRELTELFVSGQVQPFGGEDAHALLDRGCQAGDPGACHGLGEMLAEGKQVPRDGGGAVKMWERACALGDGRSCKTVAAVLFADDLVAKDEERANAALRLGCDGGDEACCSEWAWRNAPFKKLKKK